MTDLPILVRRAPRIFYVAAVLVFIFSMALTLHEISATMGYANAGGTNPAVRAMVLRALLQSALEALYLVGTGVLVHILLAIWSGGRFRAADGDRE